MNTNEQFFYENAGWSYDPKTETSEQGRQRCAKLLAQAEAWAKSNGVSYEWSKDDITNKDALAPGIFPIAASEPGPEYRLDQVLCYHHGEIIGSLGGIDFGYGVHRSQSDYKRVVEAELVIDAYLEAVETNRCACADIATA